MCSNDKLKRKSQRLAYLLRHDTEYAFNEHGWREANELISNHGFTLSMLEEIIETNNKQRYEFNDDKTKIRALQGHSVKVDVELTEAIPPFMLYHGTAVNSLDNILKEGLKPGTRLHIHLSMDGETAKKVGSRHGEPKVLKIDTERMVIDGIIFYLSNNGVWLTDFVAQTYISVIE